MGKLTCARLRELQQQCYQHLLQMSSETEGAESTLLAECVDTASSSQHTCKPGIQLNRDIQLNKYELTLTGSSHLLERGCKH